MPFCLISRLNKSILSFRFSATQFVKIPLNTTKINKLYFYFKIYQKLYFISLISTKSCILHLIYLKKIFFLRKTRVPTLVILTKHLAYMWVYTHARRYASAYSRTVLVIGNQIKNTRPRSVIIRLFLRVKICLFMYNLL